MNDGELLNVDRITAGTSIDAVGEKPFFNLGEDWRFIPALDAFFQWSLANSLSPGPLFLAAHAAFIPSVSTLRE